MKDRGFSHGLRGLGSLIAMDSKDMVRNLQTGFAMLCLFLTYLGVIFAIDFTFDNSKTEPVVTVQSSDASFSQGVKNELDARGIASVEGPEASNVLVQEDADSVVITTDAEEKPPWRDVWQAVRLSGIAPSEISIFDTEGAWKIDLVRTNLGPALGIGLMAIAFVGTAVPLVAMRERGTLRLLGSTPVSNAALVLSLVPLRIVVSVVAMVIVLAIAVTRSYVDMDDIWRLTASMVISLAMLLPIAFLFAAKARNASSMQQGMAMLTMLLVGAGGGIVPPEETPRLVQFLFNSIPTTWVMHALGADLADVTPFIDVHWLWCLMLGTGIAAFLLALKMFSWDREKDEVRAPRERGDKVVAV